MLARRKISGERARLARWFWRLAKTNLRWERLFRFASRAHRKFAMAGRHRPRRCAFPDFLFYSPIRSRRLAMAYSRFILAMKLALISAGQTASHS